MFLNLKNLFKIIVYSVFLFSCGADSSLNTPSYSDNKTFKHRGYKNEKPISPFGNLSNEQYEQEIAIQYYENKIYDGIYNLYQNQKYLTWLEQKTNQRLQKGKLNGFKHESMPINNYYYIQKSKKLPPGTVKLNEKIYLDIDRQIYKAIEKDQKIQNSKKIERIKNYKIQNTVDSSDEKYLISVTAKDY